VHVAIEAMDHFSVVGLSERFLETLVIISDELGWPIDVFVSCNAQQGECDESRECDASAEYDESREYDELIRNRLELGSITSEQWLHSLVERMSNGCTHLLNQ
jgi:hypothetical protein